MQVQEASPSTCNGLRSLRHNYACEALNVRHVLYTTDDMECFFSRKCTDAQCINTCESWMMVVTVVIPIKAAEVCRVTLAGTLTASSMVLVMAETPPLNAKILSMRGGAAR